MQRENKDQRIPLMMEQTLRDEVDSYRFSNRIGSRAEAIRQLLRGALEKEMPAQAGE